LLLLVPRVRRETGLHLRSPSFAEGEDAHEGEDTSAESRGKRSTRVSRTCVKVASLSESFLNRSRFKESF